MRMLCVGAAVAVILERIPHLHTHHVALRSLVPPRMYEDAFPGLAPNRFAPLVDCSRHVRPIHPRSPIELRTLSSASDTRQVACIL